MAIKIPLNKSQPSQRQSIILASSKFQIITTWNEQMNSWYVDIEDADGSSIVRGQRMSINFPLNIGVSNLGAPNGMLMPVSIVVESEEITRDSFDETCILAFTEL